MTSTATRTRASRGAFPASPDTLSGLVLWLKADAIVGLVNADPVATWADASGLANDATQGTAGNKPSYRTSVINSLPVVRFDGGDFLIVNGLASTFSGADLPATVIVVAAHATTTGNQTYLGMGTAASNTPTYGFQMRAASPIWRIFKRDDANVSVGPGGGVADTSAHVVSFVVPGTTAGVWSDGRGAVTAGTALDVGTMTIDRVGVGVIYRNSSTDFMNGDIAEVVVYNRALLTAERTAVERGLAAKYALTVI